MRLHKIILLSISVMFIFSGGAFGEDTNTPPTHFQIEMLKSILNDADQAAANNDPIGRRKYLQEFLKKSSESGDVSILTNIWILRAAAAIELNDDQKAWEAGQKLISFHLNNSDDPKVQNILVALGRKDLLGKTSPQMILKQKIASKFVGTWKLIYNKQGDAYYTSVTDIKDQGFFTISADSNYDLTASGSFTESKMLHDGYKTTQENVSCKITGTADSGMFFLWVSGSFVMDWTYDYIEPDTPYDPNSKTHSSYTQNRACISFTDSSVNDLDISNGGRNCGLTIDTKGGFIPFRFEKESVLQTPVAPPASIISAPSDRTKKIEELFSHPQDVQGLQQPAPTATVPQ